MPKIILLPVSGSPDDNGILATALTIGRPFHAHAVALHVRPDTRRDIASLAATSGGMTSGIDTMIDQLEAEADEREKAASDLWLGFCRDNGIVLADQPRDSGPRDSGMTAEWISEIGVAPDWLAAHGRVADLIVVGRGEDKEHPDYVLMEAALMDTGKPVVIAPSRESTAKIDGGMIGIAWKDTREAAGAVRAAMPFLRAARHVAIFNVPESDTGDRSAQRLARMLRWHNPHVTVQTLLEHSRTPAEVLLDAASQAGCGLLAMGGYGHTRLREAVFGGFTRAVLEDAPMPVLMVH